MNINTDKIIAGLLTWTLVAGAAVLMATVIAMTATTPPRIVKNDGTYLYVMEYKVLDRDSTLKRYRAPVEKTVRFSHAKHKNHKFLIPDRELGYVKVYVRQDCDRCWVITKANERLAAGKDKIVVEERWWPSHQLTFIKFTE